MPIYEYQCRKCGKRFEELVRSTDAPAPPCPACGDKRPEKQFSAFAVSSSAAADSDCVQCPSAGTGCGGGCAQH
jgi:putative FmdB family regulatory protein